MSYSISNLGESAYTDWDRAIRMAHSRNMMGRADVKDRLWMNGEVALRGFVESDDAQRSINADISKTRLRQMGGGNDFCGEYQGGSRYRTNGGAIPAVPIDMKTHSLARMHSQLEMREELAEVGRTKRVGQDMRNREAQINYWKMVREMKPEQQRQINPNRFNPITNKATDFDDYTAGAYKKFVRNLQANKGMSDPVQDPTSNFPAKKYLKY